MTTARRHTVHGDRYQWNVDGLGGCRVVPAALGDEFGDNLTCWRSVSAETKAKTLDNPPRVASVRSPGALGPMCGVSGRRYVGPPQNTYILCTNQKNPTGCDHFRRVQNRFECYNFVGVLSSTYWIDLNTETPRVATSNFGRLVLRPPYGTGACDTACDTEHNPKPENPEGGAL